MAWFSRRTPTIGVVVPAYDVADYLPECLDSVLAQSHRDLDVVVVDDGSPDASGDIAEAYARRDARVRVVHIENRGLGGARNEGVRHVRGEWLAFVDSDDVLPPDAYRTLLAHGERVGADVVTGDVVRLVGSELQRIGWESRLHPDRRALTLRVEPELLGDVFAWNKLFRRSFYDAASLHWPEGLRYEDQPTTTAAYVAADLIGVVPDVVYHWRSRDDGSSITQQRASTADLRDRWTTKRMSLDLVEELGCPDVTAVFVDRVLPGDLWRYFSLIPTADDAWWDLLVDGVRSFWGSGRSLTGSALVPADRLTGWLVEQGRRGDAELVVRFRTTNPGPIPRVRLPDGRLRLVVPGLDVDSLEEEAIVLRAGEA